MHFLRLVVAVAMGEVLLLLFIVCIMMISTLLLMEVILSEWKVVFMRVD